jgi:hypothetical protein
LRDSPRLRVFFQTTATFFEKTPHPRRTPPLWSRNNNAEHFRLFCKNFTGNANSKKLGFCAKSSA